MDALEHIINLKFFCSVLNNNSVFRSHDTNGYAVVMCPFHATTIIGTEALPFITGLVIIHSTVCPNTVDVCENKFWQLFH